MGRPVKKIPRSVWIQAVEATGGVVEDMAKMLGVHRSTIHRKRVNNDWLDAAFKSVNSITCDLCESIIVGAIKSEAKTQPEKTLKLRTAMWYLDRKGKHLGYGKHIQLDADVNQTGQVHITLPDNGRDTNTSAPEQDNAGNESEPEQD